MHREPRTGNSAIWWLAPVFILLLLEPPVIIALGRLLFPLLLLVGAAVCVARWAGAALGPGAEALAERYAAEEGEHRRRLAELRSRAEQMELTLKDLRDLQFTPEQETRARWAEVDLEEALRGTRAEMAHERGGLYSLEAVRWFGKLEPLLRNLHRLDEPEITRWLGRLDAIRTQGAGILTRLRSDDEAAAAKPGNAALRLLEEALHEIGVLRGDLVTRRAELLARGRTGLPGRFADSAGTRTLPRRVSREPGALPEARETSLARLRARLYEVRAHREVSAWVLEQDEESA